MSLPLLRHPKYLLFAALILGLGLRLPFHHITFFSVDEAVSAVAGTSILEGGLPYRDAIDHRGPLTYYAYAGIFGLFGANNMTAVHTVYLLLLLGLTWGIWVVGKTHFSESVGAWAALFFTIFSWSNPFHEMWAAHTEWLLTAASLMGMMIWLEANGRWERMLLAGILFGLCTLSKQVGALELGAVLGCIGIRELVSKDRNLVFAFRESVLLLLGWAIPMGLVAGYFWQQGAWEDWIFYLWSYNTDYYMPETDLPTRLLNSSKMLGAFFLFKWLLLGLIFLWIIGKNAKTPRREVGSSLRLSVFAFNLGKNPRELWLLCWLGASLLESLAGGRAFLHYLIPALIPLCLAAALGLESLLASRLPQRWTIALLSLGLLMPLFFTWRHHAYMLKQDTSITEFEAIVEEIQTNTSPEDRIFVWGFAPEMYVLSDRRPSSRYSFCNVLTGHIPAGNEAKTDTRYAIVPGTWGILMEELAQHPPAYLIDTQPADYRAYGKYPMSNYELGTLVEARYELESAFHAAHPEAIFHVYRRKKANLPPE